MEEKATLSPHGRLGHSQVFFGKRKAWKTLAAVVFPSDWPWLGRQERTSRASASCVLSLQPLLRIAAMLLRAHAFISCLLLDMKRISWIPHGEWEHVSASTEPRLYDRRGSLEELLWSCHGKMVGQSPSPPLQGDSNPGQCV